MSRLAVIGLLLASVAAGFALSRLLLPPEPAAITTSLDAVAAEMRDGTADMRGDFSLPDLDGEIRRLADWDGRIRLINFWATWCAPCRREIPLLKDIQARYGEHGLQVIGIAVDDAEPVAAYAAEMAFNYPVLIGQEEAIAAGESFGIDFLGLPFTLIIAADGELLNVHVGELKHAEADEMLGVLTRLSNGDLGNSAAREALAGI